jgi:uncharacterized protein involved in high-affinity Fe2+ transport
MLDVNGSMHAAGTGTFDGTITVDGYLINPASSSVADVLAYNGTAYVPTSIIVPIINDNSDLLLTTTLATNVISFTPSVNGDIVVFIYYRVITATTTVTINVTWTDGSGSQTFASSPVSAQAVGSYSIAPLYIQATTAAPIVVVATAGTASQVFVSATTMMLNTSLNSGAAPAVIEEADIFDFQITTTSSVNVLAFTPPVNENYMVYVYYRVVSATTNVTINITFDDNSGAQTLNILTLTSKAVGSYSVAPVYIQAITSAPIIVNFTSGTANNVFVSATILMV